MTGTARIIGIVFLIFFTLSMALAQQNQMAVVAAESKINEVSNNPRIEMTAEILCSDGKISTYEPVLARVLTQNLSSEVFYILKGMVNAPSLHWTISDVTGRIIASTRYPFPQEGMFGILQIAGHETKSKVYVVSGLINFTTPGLYTINVQQLDEANSNAVLAEASAILEVTPFNREKLDIRCNELFSKLLEKSKTNDLPSSVYLKALLTVKHEAVLPYLQRLAREHGNKQAARAINFLDTDRSTKIFDRLSSLAEINRSAWEASKLSDAVDFNTAWYMDVY